MSEIAATSNLGLRYTRHSGIRLLTANQSKGHFHETSVKELLPTCSSPQSSSYLPPALSLAQCLPHWEPIGIPDPSGSVSSLIWHDDGAGPSLFVGASDRQQTHT